MPPLLAKKIAVFAVVTTLAASASVTAAQASAPDARSLWKRADSLRARKQFDSAATVYASSATAGEYRRFVANAYYAAAYSSALGGSSDNAFRYLDVAINAGWDHKQHLLADSDLKSLHDDARWNRVVARMSEPKPVNMNPESAKFVTSDIDHFWSAYDAAQKDPQNRVSIYKRDYIDRGSPGLDDYFNSKVASVLSFADGVQARPRFYSAIRDITTHVKDREPMVRQMFARLKDLYPEARFPDITFVIGNFNSGGTVSESGLLIGTDFDVKTDQTPQDELTLWQKNNLQPPDRLPHIIAHELIHFQQDSIVRQRTTLSAALIEGMADFIGELISGSTANPRLAQFANGREKDIWAAFSRDMFLDSARNWIANSAQETADHPADLGYWAGYVISRGYYEQAPDKKKAIGELLHMHDPAAILMASGIPQRLGALPERYGFVATLGRDTVSVERVSRNGSLLISDEIDRFPRVIQRHTELLLDAASHVRHMEMDITLPTATTPKWKTRRVTAEYVGDSVRVTIRNGEGSKSVMLTANGLPIMPWTSQMYSLTELFAAAGMRQKGDSVALGILYVDAQADDFQAMSGMKPVGYVRALPGGRAEIFHHDGLSGAGEATMDGAGRMLSYSGARSTYKVAVARVDALPDIESIGQRFTEAERREGAVANMSARDTTSARIGKTNLLVDYGRPLVRGRELVGNVIPYGVVWRTGANAATQFSTTSAITLAGLELPAGTYTLWTLPSPQGVQLIVNRQFRQWGTQYDAARDLGRAALIREDTASPVERFTISVTAIDDHRGTLSIEWGSFRWKAPIEIKSGS